MKLFEKLGDYYNREGAGVYKNAPQKSPIRRFFEIFGTKWTSLLRANLLYVLFCLPLVTNGLGAAGLTFITRNAARGRFAYPCHDFFATIRRTWKRALPVGIINALVWTILGYNTYFYVASLFFRTDDSTAPTAHWLMFFINLIGMLLFAFMNYYIQVQVVTFDLTVKQMYKNAFLFAFHNAKSNFGIWGILAACVLVGAVPFLFVDYRIWFAVLALIYILIYPAFRSLLIQFAIFPYIKKIMVDPYYEAHPEADKRAMRVLNLETEEDAADTVFQDRQGE